GVRGARRTGRRPDAQRLSVGLLYAGRLPRPACERRPAVAADHDGAGVRQGLPARHSAAHPLLQPVLACPGHHLGGAVHGGVPDGSGDMSEWHSEPSHADRAPGLPPLERHEIVRGIGVYLIGLGLATLLTIVSFFIARTTLVW